MHHNYNIIAILHIIFIYIVSEIYIFIWFCIFLASFFSTFRAPFGIAYKAVLLMKYSLSFCLWWRVFISSSFLKNILTRYNNLGYQWGFFSTLNTSFHSLLVYKVSAEKSDDILMEIPLYIMLFSCYFQKSVFVLEFWIFSYYVSWFILLWFYHHGTFRVSEWIWMSIYLPRLGNFSAIISLNKFSTFFLCVLFGTPIMCVLIFL